MGRICAACSAPLTIPAKGRRPRFCGTACRAAAYRRRRQELSEQTPRWTGPQGRLRLARLSTFAQEQEQKAKRRAARLAWQEIRRRRAQQQAAQARRATAEAARRAAAEHQARQLAHRWASRPRK